MRLTVCLNRAIWAAPSQVRAGHLETESHTTALWWVVLVRVVFATWIAIPRRPHLRRRVPVPVQALLQVVPRVLLRRPPPALLPAPSPAVSHRHRQVPRRLPSTRSV